MAAACGPSPRDHWLGRIRYVASGEDRGEGRELGRRWQPLTLAADGAMEALVAASVVRFVWWSGCGLVETH